MVLVVAMVAIALLGFFPGLAGDTRATQSDAYWRGTARPFSITDHSLNQTSTDMIVMLQNLDSNTKYIRSINMAGTVVNASNAAVSLYLSAGQTSNVTVPKTGGGACTTGQPYEFNVTITYDTVGGITGNTQTGTKALVGTCG